jgi:hypothetical protein
MELIITREYLRSNPNHIFVFGDNLLRVGHGGTAKLRDEPNTYGFITKKAPTYKDEDYYTLEEFEDVFLNELIKLQLLISAAPNKTYLISKIGAGLANKYKIWDKIIEPNLKKQLSFDNVKFLW